MMTVEITVESDHPLWSAWDDDDWNGATAGNWVRSYAMDAVITLIPPLSATGDLVARMKSGMERGGAIVIVSLKRKDAP